MSLTCTCAIAAIAAAAVSDAVTGYIYDVVVAIGLTATVSAASLEHHVVSAIVGAVVGFGVMLLIRCASRGRGLGLGDVKLASLIGAGLGPIEGLMAIGSAFVVGAACALAFLAAGRLRYGSPVRFGPYLLAGSLCDLAYHRLSAGVFP
jgi:prepilin signal peptidase PulO-like enzyme (type II secretory pathway)